MKICFIAPYPDITCYGVRSLSAYLRRQGFDTRIIFIPGYVDRIRLNSDFLYPYRRRWLDRIAELAAETDMVGISFMTHFFDRAVNLTRAVKRAGPDIPVIWGGVHATLNPTQALQHADAVCVGEGEAPLAALLQARDRGEEGRQITHIITKNGNGAKGPHVPAFVEDLDTLPFQDFSCRDHWVLDRDRGELLPLTAELLPRYMQQSAIALARRDRPAGKGYYQTLSSRGCPLQCTYCYNSAVTRALGHKVFFRRRSVDHLIAELREAKEKFPFVTSISLADDSFFSPARTL